MNENNLFIDEAKDAVKERREIKKTIEQIQKENDEARRILSEHSEMNSPVKTYQMSDEEMMNSVINNVINNDKSLNSTVSSYGEIFVNKSTTSPSLLLSSSGLPKWLSGKIPSNLWFDFSMDCIASSITFPMIGSCAYFEI